MAKNSKIKLQIQISTFSQEGLDRLIAHSHPSIEGVRWLLSVQTADGEIQIPTHLSEREDIDIITHADSGLARNRNHALDFPCDSEYILIADDDTDYSQSSINELISFFDERPHIDFICCRYVNKGKFVKNYGVGEFDAMRPPKGWYPSAIELAFRRKSIEGFRFNENFGIGSSRYIAGEDTVFYFTLLKHNKKGIGTAITICEHNSDSTGIRLKTSPQFIKTQGAILTYAYPFTWLLRVIRNSFRSKGISKFRYMRYCIAGALGAIFRKPF